MLSIKYHRNLKQFNKSLFQFHNPCTCLCRIRPQMNTSVFTSSTREIHKSLPKPQTYSIPFSLLSTSPLITRRIPTRRPRRRQRHKLLRMRRLRCPIRHITPRNSFTPIRHHQPPQHPLENLQASFRLVIRNFMPRLVYPGKREISHLPRLPVLGVAHDKGYVPRCSERLSISVVDSEGDGFAPEPVTDVIRIPIDERNTDAVAEHLL